MTVPELRRWAAPVVYLSNNWISLAGVVIVTTSTVFWLFLLPATLRGVENPYSAILLYLALPGLFFSGLMLIPLGIAWRRRRDGLPEVCRRIFLPSTFATWNFAVWPPSWFSPRLSTS
jgi:hypothetical protein